MKPSLALSDFQRPCLLNSRSAARALAVAEAPPALGLCKPYSFFGRPMNTKVLNTISRALLEDKEEEPPKKAGEK